MSRNKAKAGKSRKPNYSKIVKKCLAAKTKWRKIKRIQRQYAEEEKDISGWRKTLGVVSGSYGTGKK